MSGIIEKLLLRNLQEVFGEGDPTRRRAAIEELYTEDCTVLLPIGRFVGRAALDQVAGELRASHPNSSTCHTARRRLSRMAGVWHGAPGRPASHPATPDSTSSSPATERSLRFMSSSTHRQRDHGQALSV